MQYKTMRYLLNDILLNRFGTEETLLIALSELKMADKRNAFIDEVKAVDSKEGQMSEMCNIVSFISKGSKLTTDIDGNSASFAMREVQDLQEGRIDSFDSPESGKVGLVHHKTLFADIDDAGYLTSPYFRVIDGKPDRSKIIQLTSAGETGKNIAMWNETFVNDDDSPKKMINVRCDGNIRNVPINKVDYVEYSQLQTLSITHAMIPLPGHSNGKRITMGCNQDNQVLLTVNNAERPLLGTGCESIIDFGNYTVENIVKEYYENQASMFPGIASYRDRVLGSSIQLVSISKVKEQRRLKFVVLEVTKINKETGSSFDAITRLTVPYNLKNYYNAVFSYKLNHVPNRVYHKGDIVAYNIGYSLDSTERVDLVDFGGIGVSEGTFDHGLAMGRNLLCGYKTFSSSTIEDAITINDRLVYDDTLTHLKVELIKVQYFNSDKILEYPGNWDAERDTHFDYRGLPLPGTLLKPGDRCMCKLVNRKSSEKTTPRYEYVGMYTEGQVVGSEIVAKGNRTEAHILVARRAEIEIGDKLVGRHGNKGVVAKVVPAEQMPYDPVSGRTLDICLNPLGVPSRQNVSQLLEVSIAMCRLLDGKATNISPYHPNDLKFIKQQIEQFNVHPIKLIDGRTGIEFKRPVNVGVIYMNTTLQLFSSSLQPKKNK